MRLNLLIHVPVTLDVGWGYWSPRSEEGCEIRSKFIHIVILLLLAMGSQTCSLMDQFAQLENEPSLTSLYDPH